MNIQDTDMTAIAQGYIQTLEDGIAALPQHVRESLYRPCAVNCVKDTVLWEMSRQFNECGGELDRQYEKYGRTEYFFADIIERGRVYELGYPRCLCPMVEAGFSTSAAHCECSRQSVSYILRTLLPQRHIDVITLHTVLGGASECRFRVIVE